jgi:hypothetical protein
MFENIEINKKSLHKAYSKEIYEVLYLPFYIGTILDNENILRIRNDLLRFGFENIKIYVNYLDHSLYIEVFDPISNNKYNKPINTIFVKNYFGNIRGYTEEEFNKEFEILEEDLKKGVF